MTPLFLRLKGFRGIVDGLGLDELTLDIAALTEGAQLIAIAGANGRGKTTILENLTPQLTMPSRASTGGSGRFSYYEHVHLPESEKELIWAHEGHSYRTQVVIRQNGSRRTEAYLHVLNEQGAWRPVKLADNTVSDGKIDTYERCVESLLGSTDTFYTSVFAAQGKRQLSAYKNAEIKNLLADLLHLEQITETGGKASETAKLLKTGLLARRQERSALQSEFDRVIADLEEIGDAARQVVLAQQGKDTVQQEIDTSKEALAKVLADHALAQQHDARRAQLQAERTATIESSKTRLAALEQQAKREAERLEQLELRIGERRNALMTKRSDLVSQRAKLESVLQDRALILDAIATLPAQRERVEAQERHLDALREKQTRIKQLHADDKLLTEQIAAKEREAGQAVLKAQDLRKRFGLTAQVPCVGTTLQGQCKLLGDAHEAQTLQPSADAKVTCLHAERDKLLAERNALRNQVSALALEPDALEVAESALKGLRATELKLNVLAGRKGELEQATATLESVNAQLQSLPDSDNEETDSERLERAAIDTTRNQIAAQSSAEAGQQCERLTHIEAMLDAMPEPFDVSQIARIKQSIAKSHETLAEANHAFLAAVRAQQRQQDLLKREADTKQKLCRLDACITHIERELGTWLLFAKCMSNDGLIALAIDDAGPAFSGLSNDLLLACYGPRFTVSIRTTTETAKGEQREGFDIVVYDAQSGESKSVSVMSGGERNWIDVAIVRAIALYLQTNAGRKYDSLFSDEADGPLDAEHKRMFMAMKREVLRLGGYEREFFVSQTPELTAMADAIIDLDAMAVVVESEAIA